MQKVSTFMDSAVSELRSRKPAPIVVEYPTMPGDSHSWQAECRTVEEARRVAESALLRRPDIDWAELRVDGKLLERVPNLNRR